MVYSESILKFQDCFVLLQNYNSFVKKKKKKKKLRTQSAAGRKLMETNPRANVERLPTSHYKVNCQSMCLWG